MLKPLACSSRLAEGVPSDRPDGRTPDEAGRSDLCSKIRHFCHSSGQKLKRPDRRLRLGQPEVAGRPGTGRGRLCVGNKIYKYIGYWAKRQ